jgi:hypothetical protein
MPSRPDHIAGVGKQQKMFRHTRGTHHHVHPCAASACRTLIAATHKSLLGTSLIIGILLVLSTSGSIAASPEHAHNPAGFFDMPSEYGEAIFRINPYSPKQLYIIGISHRDPNSGANNSTTVQAQMEVFRIGEWLKENRCLDLLLPEGYFAAETSTPSPPSSVFRDSPQLHPVLDNAYLQKSLAANSPSVNAEMLLMQHYNLSASQVEDRSIYNAVRSSLSKLKTVGDGSDEIAADIAELIYLQEVRTAQLLQNIPGVIEYEFLRGAVGSRAALFTIGLNHIKDIFRYIENGEISIESSSGVQADRLATNLNLLQRGYGVTIIIPRTLADDHKLLRMTDIDRILLAQRENLKRNRELVNSNGTDTGRN